MSPKALRIQRGKKSNFGEKCQLKCVKLLQHYHFKFLLRGSHFLKYRTISVAKVSLTGTNRPVSKCTHLFLLDLQSSPWRKTLFLPTLLYLCKEVMKWDRLASSLFWYYWKISIQLQKRHYGESTSGEERTSVCPFSFISSPPSDFLLHPWKPYRKHFAFKMKQKDTQKSVKSIVFQLNNLKYLQNRFHPKMKIKYY